MKMNSRFVRRLAFISVVVMILAQLVNACSRIFWNTNPGLPIVGRNVDFVTASHPTLVVTLRMTQ
ncbi:MAG: hypothetical protein AMJ56_11115 [Anaerolineae bacterium SG8_19]|jgi:penicillin V acylase-like amidase (Ntn superfamily)|nr:MAG: hypothetical protein AMJ56_11115 [Anaerolineae bacterium SG8_19]